MATPVLMPVEEYLSTSFEDGDREYVDGEILEKSMGEIDHGNRASRMEAKIDDYLRFGIGSVWVIDPQTGCGHIYTAEGRIAVEDGKFRIEDPAIEMDFAELFKD